MSREKSTKQQNWSLWVKLRASQNCKRDGCLINTATAIHSHHKERWWPSQCPRALWLWHSFWDPLHPTALGKLTANLTHDPNQQTEAENVYGLSNSVADHTHHPPLLLPPRIKHPNSLYSEITVISHPCELLTMCLIQVTSFSYINNIH
jgi:hypothetical protein